MLIDYIPRLQGISYATLFPEKQIGDGSMDNPYVIPHYSYHPSVERFVSDFYCFERRNLHHHIYNYQEILKKNNIEWNSHSMKNAPVDHWIQNDV